MSFAFQATSGGLELLRCCELKSPHAFSTRSGGVSEGNYRGLNLGKSAGDDLEKVEENRSRFLAALQLAGPLHVGHQVHGNSFNVAPLEHGSIGDVVLANQPGLPIGVFVADCVPILLEDRRSGAVAAVHAGWRGTAQRAVSVAVTAMLTQFGSDPADLYAAIGPSIRGCCYQVGEAVIEALGDFPDPTAFVRVEDSCFYLDLQEANRQLLVEAGVGGVALSGMCTACEPDRFFSFRRDGERSGRMLAVIAAR